MEKLYDELAHWWPLLSPPSDYLDDAAFFAKQLVGARLPAEASLLELGAGGGSLAFHLKTHVAQTVLTDLSPQMVEVSRAVNPNCTHKVGDMRTLRLDRVFDAVLIYDAIEYMRTEDDLRQALTTAHVHCAPGGVALF
ncbi:MAG: class I SAM-dependent methyltransferase, partial [Bacteroidota bacterium]